MSASKTSFATFDVEIPRDAFRLSYNVYVVSITSIDGNRYVYIGQTGDRKHLSARSIFGRLGAHFGHQRSSTENQVFKGVATKILRMSRIEVDRVKVFAYLSSCDITTRVFRIADFSADIGRTDHRELVKLVEAVETELIHYYCARLGRAAVLNTKIPKKAQKETASEKFAAAVSDTLNAAATF